MTDKTPLPGNTPGLPETDKDMTPAGVRARIAAFCAAFDVAPCKVRSRKDQVFLTDELHDWITTTGASFDWILLGNPMVMAAKYRKDMLFDRDMKKSLKNLDPEESKMFADSLAAWTAAVYARRERIEAERAAASEAA